MFKLKKIMNSCVNVPEPEIVSAQPSLVLSAGSTAYSNTGTLTKGDATTKPTHVLINAKEKGQEQALCYRITPDMIFEVEAVGDNVGDICIGDYVCLYLEGAEGYSKCSDVFEGGVAYVYDNNGATKSGDTLYVSFE